MCAAVRAVASCIHVSGHGVGRSVPAVLSVLVVSELLGL